MVAKISEADPQPDVSIVVPFYNAEPFIEQCMDGLLAQVVPGLRLEILMVDNNSTDRSAELVAAREGVRLLHEMRQGAYAARNLGVRESRGRLLAFTDPDCIPQPDWLEQLLEPFSDPEVQVVIGRTDPDGASSALGLLSAYDHEKDRFIFSSGDPRLYYGRTNNLATRRDALVARGLFVEVLRGADTVFVRQVADACGCDSVVYAPDARVLHLEIDGVAAHMRKSPLYERSRRAMGAVVEKRTLTGVERVKVLRRTLAAGSVPAWRAVPLLGLLAANVAISRLGTRIRDRGEARVARQTARAR